MIWLQNIKKNIKEKHIILQLIHLVQQLKMVIVHHQKNQNLVQKELLITKDIAKLTLFKTQIQNILFHGIFSYLPAFDRRRGCLCYALILTATSSQYKPIKVYNLSNFLWFALCKVSKRNTPGIQDRKRRAATMVNCL